MNPTGKVRTCIVEQSRIVERGPDDVFYPSRMFDGRKEERVWCVYLTVREGLKPSYSIPLLFESKSEAELCIEEHPIGSEYPDLQDSMDCLTLREWIEGVIDREGQFLGVGNIGDRESPLAFETLSQAGIYDENFGPISENVVKSLGKQRVDALKERYPENWSIAAAFEYCWLNLPHSSPACVAAHYQFHYYITGDDFSAGYLWCDLESLVHGVEAGAIAAKRTSERRAKASGAKSAELRERRRAALLEAMETVAQRNPDILRLGEKALADLALMDSVNQRPTLWSQGKGQVAEYLGEIRRGEAGDDMQRRYQALLPAKPPKRQRD